MLLCNYSVTHLPPNESFEIVAMSVVMLLHALQERFPSAVGDVDVALTNDALLRRHVGVARHVDQDVTDVVARVAPR